MVRYDEIGYWSEVKLDIVKEYAQAYSRILSAQTSPKLHHIYIDAFAGLGVHISKSTGEFVPGSPMNALLVQPSFKDYYLIDMDGEKTAALREMAGTRDNVHVEEGDCNRVLLEKVFPKARWEDYRRALCLLDPYKINLNWEVVATAGKMRSVEIFLNFMVMDMNMNVLWRNPDDVDPRQAERMDKFWGDRSWHKAAYKKRQTLFGPIDEKAGNEAIVTAYQERLRTVAGFKYVPEPMPMRNTTGSVIYYLFFASQKPVAVDIVRDIFAKYRNRGQADGR